MSDKNKWITYLAIILVGGIFGYILGSRRKNAEIWACVGVTVGFLVDLIIWYITRQESYKNLLEHDHEHDHGSELPAFLQWLGNFHPPSVNFPVGLLVAAALAELLLMVTRRSWFASAARFCIWIGALGAIVAASLGWLFGGIQLTDSDWIMTTHRWLGTSTAILALIVLGLSESHHRQPDAPARSRWYRGALFLSAALVSATGFFGGAMIYGIDHYAW